MTNQKQNDNIMIIYQRQGKNNRGKHLENREGILRTLEGDKGFNPMFQLLLLILKGEWKTIGINVKKRKEELARYTA